MRIVLALLAALLLALFASCGGDDTTTTPGPTPPELQGLPKLSLTGASFEDGGSIPKEFTCDNPAAKSPNLLWHGLPETSKSVVVWVNDTDAANFVHWLVFDIPPGEPGLTAGTGEEPILGDGAHQGKNSFGRFGYGPPCPNPKQTHHYVFNVYALDTKLGLTPGASATDVASAMLGHYLAYGKLTATYTRPEN